MTMPEAIIERAEATVWTADLSCGCQIRKTGYKPKAGGYVTCTSNPVAHQATYRISNVRTGGAGMRYHGRIPPATAVASGSHFRPGWKPYRWNGDPALRNIPPAEPERRRRKKTTDVPTPRQERLARLAEMRLWWGDPHPPAGYVTIAQAAEELGVDPRTIVRYKAELRKSGAA